MIDFINSELQILSSEVVQENIDLAYEEWLDSMMELGYPQYDDRWDDWVSYV